MSQDYKLFIRAVYGGATIYDQPGGAVVVLQNAAETQDHLNEFYLNNGYKILSVDYLGEFILNPDAPQSSPTGPRFAWHLVKDLDESKAKKSDVK
jgi:hypothetical protein